MRRGPGKMLLDDLPRGVRSRKLDDHRTPLAAWMPPDLIASSNSLSYDPDNPGAKLLLRIRADDSKSICRLGQKYGAEIDQVRPLQAPQIRGF